MKRFIPLFLMLSVTLLYFYDDSERFSLFDIIGDLNMFSAIALYIVLLLLCLFLTYIVIQHRGVAFTILSVFCGITLKYVIFILMRFDFSLKNLFEGSSQGLNFDPALILFDIIFKILCITLPAVVVSVLVKATQMLKRKV